jgi:WD40 repeat protein
MLADESISASGDRSIKIWCIHTGARLFTLESVHPRGIASLDFKPASNGNHQNRQTEGDGIKGTIVTGSSDATIRLCTLVTGPSIPEGLDGLSINETDTEIQSKEQDVRIVEGPLCWTDCLCPPSIRKATSTNCMRCWNRGHTGLVRSLHLEDDLVISGGYDGTVKVSSASFAQSVNRG